MEVYERVEERNERLFDFRVQTVTSAIDKRMQDYVQILKGAQGLYQVSDTVSREDWMIFVKSLEVNQNYPGILGIGFSKIVPEEKIKEFVIEVREKEYSHFKVWPESDRSVYTSILFLEPLNERNLRALGFDMFSDSTRREAMVKARDTGRPALTGMVKLVQETSVGVQNGFLLYLPVYGKPSQELFSEAERRKNIIGYAYSPFRVNDLMEGIIGHRFPDIDIEIYDGTVANPSTLLYDRDTVVSYPSPKAELSRLSSLQIAGHDWLVFIKANSDFGNEVSYPWFILGGGIIISSLLFVIMYSVANIRKSTYMNQLITDNATSALFIVNNGGGVTFMNPAAELLSGFSYENVKNHNFHELLHHSFPDGSLFPMEECSIDLALKSKTALYNHEDVFFTKNGEIFYGNLNAQPILENGKVVSHLIEIRDISLEKQAEMTLKETNRNLKILNKIGKSLSAELDLKKLIQLVTDSCTDLCGAEFGAFFYKQENDEGESFMLHALSGTKADAFKNLPHPGKTKVFEPTFHGDSVIRSEDITKDPRYGKNFPEKGIHQDYLKVKSYLAVPVISRGGNVFGGLLFGHSKVGVFTQNSEDIVKGIAAQAAIALDNSELFETLKLKNKELTRINNDLDIFVYTASHDLKAPVLNIEGLVYALTKALEQGKPERINQIVELMKLSVHKFKDTIQALTEVSKINKNIDEELEKIDVKEILEDVKTSIRDMIENSGAKIVEAIDCRGLMFSKPNMRSILHNLLTNAIKYSNPSKRPEICISCRKEENNFILQVSDNGLGIPENQLSKIFVMFKRYHSHVNGTGVGLYLVKRIAENYGGEVKVESEVEKGTTFTISLPDNTLI